MIKTSDVSFHKEVGGDIIIYGTEMGCDKKQSSSNWSEPFFVTLLITGHQTVASIWEIFP